MKVSTKVWAIVAAVFLIAGVAFVVIGLTRPKVKIYGQVGSHKITKADFDQTFKGATNVTSDQVLTTMMDRWLYYDIAQKYKIKVTSEEINNEIKHRLGEFNNYAGLSYVKIAVTRDLYKQKLQAELGGFSKGKYVVAHFDRYIVSEDVPAYPDNPIKGRDQRIAADRIYAENFIKGIYAKLKSKEITFEQAIELEKNDTRIGLKADPTIRHSSDFDTGKDLPGNAMLGNPDVKTQLAILKPGSYTAPFVVKTVTSPRDDSPRVDSWFLILQLENSKPKGALTFDQEVAANKSKLGYKKYDISSIGNKK